MTDHTNRRRARNVRITPKGYAVLRAIERGKYKFATNGQQKRGPDGRFIADSYRNNEGEHGIR